MSMATISIAPTPLQKIKRVDLKLKYRVLLKIINKIHAIIRAHICGSSGIQSDIISCWTMDYYYLESISFWLKL